MCWGHTQLFTRIEIIVWILILTVCVHRLTSAGSQVPGQGTLIKAVEIDSDTFNIDVQIENSAKPRQAADSNTDVEFLSESI